MSGLMFTSTGSSWRSRKAAGGARCGNLLGSRTAGVVAAAWLARPASKEGRAEVLLLSEVVRLRDPAPVVDERASGHFCVVVAASLIPKQPSDWIRRSNLN